MPHPKVDAASFDLHSGLLLHNDVEYLYISTRPYAQQVHAVGCGVAQLNILVKFIILCRYLFLIYRLTQHTCHLNGNHSIFQGLIV